MDSTELLKFCLGKGLLLDKEILSLFSETSDVESVKVIIEKIRNYTQKRIITKDVVAQNKDKVSEFFLDLPEENQKNLENLKIKLGLSIEISATRKPDNKNPLTIEILPSKEEVKIISQDIAQSKKLEVKDFVNYFRNRFNDIKNILAGHSGLTNLVSINKIAGDRQGISIIGIISDKRVTKNKNILLDVEDLTGKIRVLINKNKKDLYQRAEEITLDSVIGFRGSGNREILFVNEIVFPDAMLFERKKSPVEEYALFIGDLHIGSKLFLEENFVKFIDYLNDKVPNTPEANKIKYLFIVGDLITGVGNYPGQEKDIVLPDLESHFEKAAALLSKIRGDIKIIISTGNHDGVRLMEPQPILNKKYAWPLYNLKNVIFSTNPSQIKIGMKDNFSGFNVLTYHGFSFVYYASNISYLMKQKAIHKPELIMTYVLRNRHLAPTHSSTQYFPAEKDPHFIKTIPDIFVSGHLHKSGVAYYNNILMISISTWEKMTPYMEKVGSKPDFCKVPMFNLKTRAIKILDFE